MTTKPPYEPGPAGDARIEKQGDAWTLVLTRDLRHAPALVWGALTDPAQITQWSPYDADRDMGHTGPVKLTTVGTPQVADCTITRVEAERVLDFDWGGQPVRWELEPLGSGTRLTLGHRIDRRFIAWGAAGWHLCFEILDAQLAGAPIGRHVGPALMKFPGWQRLVQEYSARFEIEPPAFG